MGCDGEAGTVFNAIEENCDGLGGIPRFMEMLVISAESFWCHLSTVIINIIGDVTQGAGGIAAVLKTEGAYVGVIDCFGKLVSDGMGEVLEFVPLLRFDGKGVHRVLIVMRQRLIVGWGKDG